MTGWGALLGEKPASARWWACWCALLPCSRTSYLRTEKSGVAFCEAGKLSQMVSFSSRVLQGRGEAGTSLLIPLLMYRNPLGDVVRPALLQLGFVW